MYRYVCQFGSTYQNCPMFGTYNRSFRVALQNEKTEHKEMKITQPIFCILVALTKKNLPKWHEINNRNFGWLSKVEFTLRCTKTHLLPSKFLPFEVNSKVTYCARSCLSIFHYWNTHFSSFKGVKVILKVR